MCAVCYGGLNAPAALPCITKRLGNCRGFAFGPGPLQWKCPPRPQDGFYDGQNSQALKLGSPAPNMTVYTTKVAPKRARKLFAVTSCAGRGRCGGGDGDLPKIPPLLRADMGVRYAWGMEVACSHHNNFSQAVGRKRLSLQARTKAYINGVVRNKPRFPTTTTETVAFRSAAGLASGIGSRCIAANINARAETLTL